MAVTITLELEKSIVTCNKLENSFIIEKSK